MTTQHTPTPWRAEPCQADQGETTVIVGHTGRVICTVDSDCWHQLDGKVTSNNDATRSDVADVKTLLRAVNAHDELLTALGTLVAAVNVKKLDPLVVFAAIEKARAAIARATEVQS